MPDRRRAFRWLSVMVLLTLVACGTHDVLGPDAPQGIEGIVLLGPQCPVQLPDDSCPDLPYQAVIDVRAVGGGVVTRVRSAADGRFRVGLLPGSYVVDPESGSLFPTAESQEVLVQAGVYTAVTIHFDTGIRQVN